MKKRFETRRTLWLGMAVLKTILLVVNERSRLVWQGMKNINPWGY